MQVEGQMPRGSLQGCRVMGGEGSMTARRLRPDETMSSMPWPSATQLDTARLSLEPLKFRHATEMVAALAAPELYAFTCGEPPTEDILRPRYRRQALGLNIRS